MRIRDLIIALIAGVLTGGISALIGIGAARGALGIALTAVVVGTVMALGVALVLGALRPAPRLLEPAYDGISESTANELEQVLQRCDALGKRVSKVRLAVSDEQTRDLLADADELLSRVQTLANSESIQGLNVYAGEIALLDGITDRYLPELLDAAETNIAFLDTFGGSTAKEEARANLSSIDSQLTILTESVDRMERDIVQGVSQSLEVHAQFLRTRFAQADVSPLIDV